MAQKPSNWYGMSNDERREWERQNRAIEDAEYDQQRAQEAADRARSEARRAQEDAKRERSAHEEERDILQSEIEEQRSARYDVENERDELKGALADELALKAILLTACKEVLARLTQFEMDFQSRQILADAIKWAQRHQET